MTTAAGIREWEGSAFIGSPDFLIYLHRNAVTWSELWSFYEKHSSAPGAPLALGGFFHAAMSRVYDQEGSVLDCDRPMYPQLREWARFAVAREDSFPEDRLRDSLAGLLALGLVSSFYYEVVFSVYLEACLERQWESALREGKGPVRDWVTAVPLPKGRLVIRWPERMGTAATEEDAPWVQALSRLAEAHYSVWNHAYCIALGESAGEQFDEGGEG